MNGTELLTFLISNMETQVENMNWLKENVDKRIIIAVNNDSPVGKLNKADIIIQLLEHERYVNNKITVYEEVKEWAEDALKSGNVK